MNCFIGLFYCFCLNKSNEEVCEEIPNGCCADGENFGEVEVPLKLANQEPNNKAVDAQSNHGNGNEFSVFLKDVWVLAVECVNSVENVVGSGCGGEANSIGNVLVNLSLFL